MKFIVHRSTGTDSGSNVYVSTNCQDDYDDIRFTNSSNQLLDYWIESSDSSSATIWVEADSLASGNTTLYLYYGNSSETTAVSNGENTFEFFDGFEGSNLSSAKWTVSSGFPSVASNILSLPNSTTIIYSNLSFSSPCILETRSTEATGNSRAIQGFSNSSDWNDMICWEDYELSGFWYHKTETKKATVKTLYDYTPVSGYLKHKIERINDSLVNFYKNNSLVRAHTTNINTGALVIKLYGGTGASGLNFDWIFVRKYTSSEPSASWGLEESF